MKASMKCVLGGVEVTVTVEPASEKWDARALVAELVAAMNARDPKYLCAPVDPPQANVITNLPPPGGSGNQITDPDPSG